LRVAHGHQALAAAGRAHRRDAARGARLRRREDQEPARHRRLQRAAEEGCMRLAIVGQQDFGKAVLEAFLARGDQVAAVFCAPEKEGGRPDSLRVAAQEMGLKVHQFKSLKAPEAVDAMRAANADIGIMAFVLQFAPQEFVRIPKHGTIQYHPSLLPKYRGPSSINWPISRGDKETGLTIFRPTDGLDEG